MALMSSQAPHLVISSYIEWALKAYRELKADYEMFEDYYAGDQPLGFSTQRWVDTFGSVFDDFADNWCGVVADSEAQRLEIIGWDCDDNEAKKMAEEIWEDGEVDIEEDDLHLQTLVKGDGYLIVWPDPELDTDERPLMHFNDALYTNVYYDPANQRRIIRASKYWTDEETGEFRLNLYFPDRVEQYLVPQNAEMVDLYGFRIPDPENLQDEWKNLGSLNNPYSKVPVFHFKNRPIGTHGQSELKTVAPIQQMLNKMMMDVSLGSEFAGFPQRWATGGGQPKDGWKGGPERVWQTTDPNAKFGQFDAMDFDGPRGILELLVGHVAKTTQTPMHFLRTSGDMPSGEALKVAESGLVSKVKRVQKRWRHEWGKAMSFAIFLKLGRYPKSVLHPIWKSPETRHDLEQAQTAQLKSILGVPLRQVWSEHFGYSDEKIDEFEKLNKQIAAATLAQLLTQTGQAAPGANGTLGDLLGVDPAATNLAGMDIPQILALLNKGQTSKTTAGEATTNPQANTRPPGSPTRRSTGFKD